MGRLQFVEMAVRMNSLVQEIERDPCCDDCGAKITTGFMFIGCPKGDKCFLFPHDSDDDVKEFARNLIYDAD